MTLIKNNVKTNTAAHYGDWYCIMSLEDNTTLDFSSSATAVYWQENGATPSTDLDLITGVPYYGDFSAIQLFDGKIIAYNK